MAMYTYPDGRSTNLGPTHADRFLIEMIGRDKAFVDAWVAHVDAEDKWFDVLCPYLNRARARPPEVTALMAVHEIEAWSKTSDDGIPWYKTKEIADHIKLVIHAKRVGGTVEDLKRDRVLVSRILSGESLSYNEKPKTPEAG